MIIESCEQAWTIGRKYLFCNDYIKQEVILVRETFWIREDGSHYFVVRPIDQKTEGELAN